MITKIAPQYFSPEVLAMIQGIYDEVTQMSWFPNHPTDRNLFAIDLISFYENGMTEPHALRKFALEYAEKHYGLPRRGLSEGGEEVASRMS